MKKIILFITLLIWLLTVITGCDSFDVNSMRFWIKEGQDRQVLEDVDNEVTQEETPQATVFNVFTATPLSNKQNLNIYEPGNYTELARIIKEITLDNYIGGVLDNERTKTGDNPYLIGDRTEEQVIREQLNDLEDKISRANPVEWEIVKLVPVGENACIIAVEYLLPDGRKKVSGDFVVKLRGGIWFIDFQSFYRSFNKVEQFASAGK